MSPAAALAGLAWLGTITLAFALARLARHQRDQRRFALDRLALPPGPPPLVSILVPARNEERNIEACLGSLLAQDHPAIEVLVWDDASEDRTRILAESVAARDPRVRVLAGGPPPPGWMGKCHACDGLARQARGEWLLFVDADTTLARDSVSTGLGHALAHRLAALSCSGRAVLGSFWERAWEPPWPCLLYAWLPPGRVNDPDSRVAFAVGQWFLFHRRAYAAVGGHAAVRGEMVEDCALAARLKAARVGFQALVGTDLFQVRMYRGLGEIWQGWSKNADRALRLFGGGSLAAPLTAVAALLAGVAPFPIALLWAAGLTPTVGAATALGPSALALGASYLVRRRGRSSPGLFWTLPLASAVAAGVLLNSWIATRLGRPLGWKGRSYPGGAPAGAAAARPSSQQRGEGGR